MNELDDKFKLELDEALDSLEKDEDFGKDKMTEIDDVLQLKIKYDQENLEEKIIYLLEKYDLGTEIQKLFFMIIDKGIEALINE